MNNLLEHVTLPIRPSELAAIIPELLLPYSHQCRPAKSLKSRPSYRRVIYRCPIFIGLGLAISETKIVTRIFSRSPKLDHPRQKNLPGEGFSEPRFEFSFGPVPRMPLKVGTLKACHYKKDGWTSQLTKVAYVR